METVPAIAMDGVTFSYDGHAVLEDVRFTIPAGEFVTIVGPNGGGKTTLLLLALGLIHPARGTVRVLGTTPEGARPRIGYMPQYARIDPTFPARVVDVVLMGRLGGRRFGAYTPDDRAAAADALRQVELENHAPRRFADLSGGERQRVLIARALASTPALLLLDEPTSSLDVAMERELFDLLGALRDRMTVVLVSHDLGFVSSFTDTVVCVKRTVAVHAMSEVTGDLIMEMYGRDVRMVRHDHDDHRRERS